MPALYWASVTLHVLAALLWLGGMFFLGVVGAPALRAVEPPALRSQLFQTLGMRFRTVGWTAIAVLAATGIANLHYRGLLRWEGALGSTAFWSSPLGAALGVKLATVAIMLAVSFVHDFIHGPAAGRQTPGSPEALRMRRRASIYGRVNALLGVVLVIAAVRLARGG